MKSDFRDLEIWKEGRNIRLKIEKLAKEFPADEKYRLCDQMIRAARSVTALIAEGYGRYHYQENIQFCRQARASLYELIDHLIVAKDNKYFDDPLHQNLIEDIKSEIKRINGYIKYLKNQKEKGLNP